MADSFPTESTFQGDLSKEFFPLIRLFQLYLNLKTLHEISTKNTHVAENLKFIMQSTFPGVLTEKHCIDGVGTTFQA